MAKSLRSKVKRSFRSKKRETGVYAAAHAARLQRLNSKLVETAKKDADGDLSLEALGGDDETADIPAEQNGVATQPDAMAVDAGKPQRISTHGPRGSRREEWRKSKGLDPRPAVKGMNRQGGIAGRRKSGRPSRRR